MRPLIRNLVVGATGVVVVATAAVLLAEPVTGMTPGAWVLELKGETDTRTGDTLSALSGVGAPSWLPGATASVTVRRPGAQSHGDEPAGSIKIDGVVPAGWKPPATCTPAEFALPWDGGGRWPDLTVKSSILQCSDGATSWRLFEQGQHVYVWK